MQRPGADRHGRRPVELDVDRTAVDHAGRRGRHVGRADQRLTHAGDVEAVRPPRELHRFVELRDELAVDPADAHRRVVGDRDRRRLEADRLVDRKGKQLRERWPRVRLAVQHEPERFALQRVADAEGLAVDFEVHSPAERLVSH